jgi:two-component system, OmpR family, sensor histidine kinase BaeS
MGTIKSVTSNLPRLEWRLSVAMVASVLLTSLIIVAAFGVFVLSRLPIPGPAFVRQRDAVQGLLAQSGTKIGLLIESDSKRQVIDLPDEMREVLYEGLRTSPPIWVAQALGVGITVSVMLGLLAARIGARRLSKPIESVSDAASRMGQGDLSVRAPTTPHPSDVIETTTLARNFNAMAEALEQSERHRRDMIADIAHELRTPLGVISSRLEALEDELIPFNHAEVLKLKGHANLLTRLVADLRILSLADTGQLEIHPRRFDLSASAQRMVSSLMPRAEQLGVTLRVKAPEPLQLKGDEDRIAQVISNLVDNALRHTPSGGEIIVRVSNNANTAQLEVLDTGPGIPEDHLTRIFERFHRADPSRNRASGGSGLGLAIVRTLVELHGGTVSAGNRKLNGAISGAVLTVCLPISAV